VAQQDTFDCIYCLPYANIESSPVWDTSSLAEIIYDLLNRQFLCGKCPKPVTIQYLLATYTFNQKTIHVNQARIDLYKTGRGLVCFNQFYKRRSLDAI